MRTALLLLLTLLVLSATTAANPGISTGEGTGLQERPLNTADLAAETRAPAPNDPGLMENLRAFFR